MLGACPCHPWEHGQHLGDDWGQELLLQHELIEMSGYVTLGAVSMYVYFRTVYVGI